MEGLVIPYHGHMIRIAAPERGRWKLLAADKVPWEEQGRPYFSYVPVWDGARETNHKKSRTNPSCGTFC